MRFHHFRKLRIMSVILYNPNKLRFITTLRASIHDFMILSQLEKNKMRLATSLPNIYANTRKFSGFRGRVLSIGS